MRGLEYARPVHLRHAIAIVLFLLGTSCGGGSPSSARPDPSANSSSGGPSSPASKPAANSGTHPADPAASDSVPTDAECQKLLDHFLALASAAHAETVDADEIPTPDQLATIRARLAPEFVARCRELDRAVYRCELQAASQKEMLACSTPDASPTR